MMWNTDWLTDIKSNLGGVRSTVIINLDILEELCPLEWSGDLNGIILSFPLLGFIGNYNCTMTAQHTLQLQNLPLPLINLMHFLLYSKNYWFSSSIDGESLNLYYNNIESSSSSAVLMAHMSELPE